jgi:hypothetical protein
MVDGLDDFLDERQLALRELAISLRLQVHGIKQEPCERNF